MSDKPCGCTVTLASPPIAYCQTHAQAFELKRQAEEDRAAIRDLMKCFNDMPVFDGYFPAHDSGCQYPYGSQCSCGMKQWRERWNELEYKTHAETIARAEQRKGD